MVKRVVCLLLPVFILTACDQLLSGTNIAPTITLTASATKVHSGEECTLHAQTGDPNADPVTLSWHVDGVIVPGETKPDFRFSRKPGNDTEYEIRAIATDGKLESIASIKISVLSQILNPFPGRWAFTFGTSSLTYWFYDDLTFHRENSYGESSAGYYSFTPTALSFHAVGSTLDEEYSYAISDGMLVLKTGDTVVATLKAESELKAPANNVPTVTIDGGDRQVINGVASTFTASAADSDAGDVLLYEWLVNGVRRNGETASSFSFKEEPEAATDYVIAAVVSDGKNVARAEAVASVSAPVGKPGVTVTSTAGSSTNAAVIPFTLTFTEPVAAFDKASVAVVNGTAQTLTQGDAPVTWTLTVLPSAEGAVTVTVPAGITASVATTKTNMASAAISVTFDTTAPGVTITSTDGDFSEHNPVPFVVSFTETATGFTQPDLTVSNGTVSGFTETTAGRTWNVTVAPTVNPGLVKLSLGAGTVADTAGNPTAALAEKEVTYSSVFPVPTLTKTVGNVTKASPFTVRIEFSMGVTGFTQSDLVLTNCTASSFTEVNAGTVWRVAVTPQNDGAVTVTVPAVCATDTTYGLPNRVNGSVSVTYDTTAPVLSVVSPAAGSTVYGATKMSFSDSEPGNPQASVNGSVWTAIISGQTSFEDIAGYEAIADEGTFTLYLRDTDAAGNTGTCSTAFTKSTRGSSSVTVNLIIPLAAPIDFGTFDGILDKKTGETMTVTAGFADATAYRWMLTGTGYSNAGAGAASSITIDSTALAPGIYNLTAIVTKDGKQYSNGFPFEIRN